VTVPAIGHDSTAPRAADHISETIIGYALTREGKPDCDVFTMDILSRFAKVRLCYAAKLHQLGNLVASQWPTQLGH